MSSPVAAPLQLCPQHSPRCSDSCNHTYSLPLRSVFTLAAAPLLPSLQAFGLIEASLGRPLGEVFSSISERPIAAASLGQVYKAVLRDTGEEVAVKVGRVE